MAALGTVLRLLMLVVGVLLAGAGSSVALEPIVIGPNDRSVEITALADRYEDRGDRILIETAPGPDGISGRIQVRAATPGTNPVWLVFAIRNDSSRPIERLLTVDRYDIVGSKVFWPDLDASRITAVTPSVGFQPERLQDDRADMFRLSVEPGATVTYVVELRSVGYPRLFLWDAAAYENKLRGRSLFHGIMLGITGILAVFLTVVFAANHKAIFPAAALFAWSVLAYLCIDFGFWHKLFQTDVANTARYRAMAEAALAASLLLFLVTYLRLGMWQIWIRLACFGWLAGQVALIGLAALDAPMAAGLARASVAAVAGVGTLLIGYLVFRGQERALSLVPTWLLLLVWIFGAAMTLQGDLSGPIVVSFLVSGLVLIVGLITFTVTQYAFRSADAGIGLTEGQTQLRALALEASGAAIWDWQTGRNQIVVSHMADQLLGLPAGTLTDHTERWLQRVHPSDRQRLRIVLEGARERNAGELDAEFRLRRDDGSYLWFQLKAQPVDPEPGGPPRWLGALRDITGQKRARERLLHDAVHDSLTGLPNRELFLDRLSQAIARAKSDQAASPTVLFIDIDRFKNVNTSFGLAVGDSMLLTIARRLSRQLQTQDTLARVGGDQFAVLLSETSDPKQIALAAERMRRSLRSPMKLGGKEIVLTGSFGIAVYDGHQERHNDLLKEAEVAMYRAKRLGADRIEIFKPDMRNGQEDRLVLESELRRALEREQLTLLFQPIISLTDGDLAGFEALLRWDHPRLGRLGPTQFIPIAEEAGIISELGMFVLERALGRIASWQETLSREREPLFVSVNISSQQLFRQDLVQELRQVLGRESVPRESLWIEVTESLVMENPEQAAEILARIKALGAGLSLDDFGTGYSSLSYLHRFPFDTVKVPRSLLGSGSGSLNGSGPVILKSIVAMAHELGKKVVTEGVETRTEGVFLRSIGCDFAQGFFFGEPMNDKAVQGLLLQVKKMDKRKRAKPPALTDERATKPEDPPEATGAMQETPGE